MNSSCFEQALFIGFDQYKLHHLPSAQIDDFIDGLETLLQILLSVYEVPANVTLNMLCFQLKMGAEEKIHTIEPIYCSTRYLLD